MPKQVIFLLVISLRNPSPASSYLLLQYRHKLDRLRRPKESFLPNSTASTKSLESYVLHSYWDHCCEFPHTVFFLVRSRREVHRSPSLQRDSLCRPWHTQGLQQIQHVQIQVQQMQHIKGSRWSVLHVWFVNRLLQKREEESKGQEDKLFKRCRPVLLAKGRIGM